MQVALHGLHPVMVTTHAAKHEVQPIADNSGALPATTSKSAELCPPVCLPLGQREDKHSRTPSKQVPFMLQAAACAERTCVYAEDAALGLGIWQGELNLPVNAPRPNESRVQRLNAVGCHDHLRKP
jgi:hypothetical protein